MRRLLPKYVSILILFTCITCISSYAQSVTGIWRGYFISESGDQYKLEFQVKQNNQGNFAVSGVSYSYLDKRFYGKATMTGNFIRNSKSFRIREIKTVEVKNLGGGGTCIMNYDLDYTKSGKEEFLEGTYLGKPESEDQSLSEWGDCGGGKVYLRKVTTSDFYVEPFLRPQTSTTKKSPAASPNKTLTPVKPPVVKKTAPDNVPPKTTVKATPPATTTKTSTKTPGTVKAGTKTSEVTQKAGPVQKADTITRLPQITAKVPVRSIPPAPSVIKNRQNEVMISLVVNVPNVVVKLYDNGEIDDDSISVYFDNKLMLDSKRLTGSPLTINLVLEDDGSDHELVMVAENLGRIPPNTSLMVVQAGDQNFNVRITSNEQKNAVVRFRYSKP